MENFYYILASVTVSLLIFLAGYFLAMFQSRINTKTNAVLLNRMGKLLEISATFSKTNSIDDMLDLEPVEFGPRTDAYEADLERRRQ